MSAPTTCLRCGSGVPSGAPWCGACGAVPGPGTAPTVVEACRRFASGDWPGAVLAVACGIGSVAALAVVGLAPVGASDAVSATPGQLLALVAVVVALAAGGAVDLDSGTAEGIVRVADVPLLLTAVGFGTLAAVFARRLRRRGVHGLGDAAVQAVRVWVVLLGVLLAVGLAGRYRGGTSTAPLRTTVDVARTLLTGSGWLLFALLVAVVWWLPALLPPAARRFRDGAGGPVVGAVVTIVLASVVEAVLWTVAFVASDSVARLPADTVSTSAGVLFLLGPNLLLIGFALALGTPLTLPASVLRGIPGLGGRPSVQLLDLTDRAPLLWLLPLVAAVAVVAGGLVAALHAPSPQEARRSWWRSGVALAAVLSVIACGTAVSVSGQVYGATGGHVRLDLVLAVLLGLLWGGAGGFLGALLAPVLPPRLIDAVRGRMVRGRQRAYVGPVPRPVRPAPRPGPPLY